MTRSLARFQSDFASALFDPDSALALTSQPAFAVYRNTVMGGCVDALEANFPSVARLVGADWFRAAAVAYVRVQAPRDGRMLVYGEGFAEFLAEFEPGRELPYLADVARLDRFWIESHAAADADAVDSAWLARLSPEALGAVHLAPHPAARWRWFADAPIYSIWRRNRVADDAIDTDDEMAWQGEGALLTRPLDAVAWQGVNRFDTAFLDACAAGRVLGDAAAAALEVQPDADIAELLARLLRAGALSSASADQGGAP
jgi:hypothetical protein